MNVHFINIIIYNQHNKFSQISWVSCHV